MLFRQVPTSTPKGLYFLFLFLGAWIAAPANAVELMVRVVDAATGAGIADARVRLPQLGRTGSSDPTGWSRFEALEAGSYEAHISASGYGARSVRLDILPGQMLLRREFFLSADVIELADFVVAESLSEADLAVREEREAVAPTEIISSETLQDAANETIGDALQTIAGVDAESAEGSVTAVKIRGASARQTRITIDGQSMAGGGGRGTSRGAAAMSQVPREFLQRVQITKAATPDMDADAIGGSVDMQTSRIAQSQAPRTSLSFRHKYVDPYETWAHRINVAHAHPFSLGDKNRRVGMLLSVNAEEGDSTSVDYRILNQWPFRNNPEDGEPTRILARFRSGLNTSTRDGFGLLFNSDLQWGKPHHFFFKVLFAERDQVSLRYNLTHEFVRGSIVSLTPDSGDFEKMRMEQRTSRQLSTNRTGSIVLGGEHRLGDWKLSESIGYSLAEVDRPLSATSVFRTRSVINGGYSLADDYRLPRIFLYEEGIPQAASDALDPALFEFSRLDFTESSSRDHELATRFDLEKKSDARVGHWQWKAGAKARLRNARNNVDRLPFGRQGAAFTVEDFTRPGPTTIYGGRYATGPLSDPLAVEAFQAEHPERFRFDALNAESGSATSDYEVSESIYATYGMLERRWESLTLIAGVRMEYTESDTRGFESVTQTVDGNRFNEITAVRVRDAYTRVFPGAHLLYRAKGPWVLRTSITRALQRPDFRDLSPSTRVNLDSKTIRAGNPELKPYDSKAFDLGVDIFLNRAGTLSLGVFHKRIRDFIVDIEETVDYLDEPGFNRSIPVNGSPGKLWGFESAWAVDLNFLPGTLETTSFQINYTVTDSTAAYPGHPGTLIMLPEQVRSTFNASLRWKRGPLTLNLRSRYRGLQLIDLTEPGQDQFGAPVWSYSLSAQYRLNQSASLSIGLSKLNRPDSYGYQGSVRQPIRNREGSLYASISLSLRFQHKPPVKPNQSM